MLRDSVTSFICVTVLLSVVEGNCRNCIKCGDNGECLKGCKPGFAGRICDHECSSHCVDSLCNLDASTGTLPCSIGCTPGYYGLHCNAPCISTDDEGVCDRFSGTTPDCKGTKHGNSCEISCMEICDGSMCDNKGGCFEEVCIPGRHGTGCSDDCGSNCKICHKDTGECIRYIDKDVQDKSKCSCDNSGAAQVNPVTGYLITIIILILLPWCVVFVIYVYKTYCRTVGKSLCVSSANYSNVPAVGDGQSVENAEQLKKKLAQTQAVQAKIIRQEEAVEKLSGLYRLRSHELEDSVLLVCTNIKFDEKTHNAQWVNCDTDVVFNSISQPILPYNVPKLKTYGGTCITGTIPKCESPQYFEVKSLVDISKSLTEKDILLEMRLVRRKENDQSHYLAEQPQGYSLIVSHCTEHNSLCRQVCRPGNNIACLPDTLANVPGTSGILYYGVVFDSSRGHLAFLDLIEKRIIGKIDNVERSVLLLPIFGVYFSFSGEIRTSFIVGNDIDMTTVKKSLIEDCLS